MTHYIIIAEPTSGMAALVVLALLSDVDVRPVMQETHVITLRPELALQPFRTEQHRGVVPDKYKHSHQRKR